MFAKAFLVVASVAIIALAALTFTHVNAQYNQLSFGERVAVEVFCADPMKAKSFDETVQCTIIDHL